MMTSRFKIALALTASFTPKEVQVFAEFFPSTLGSDSSGRVLPKESKAETPWEDLAALVSSSDVDVLSGPTDVNEWAAQCAAPFQLMGDAGIAGYNGEYAILSNYYLVDAPSGLCLDFVSCAFQNCIWPTEEGLSSYPNFPLDSASPFALSADDDDSSSVADTFLTDTAEPYQNLPARVLHPLVVADIVHAVQFARDHQVGITVKVNGHSYFGSSSARNTLLVKMSTQYPKYDELGSLVECASLTFGGDDSNLSPIPSANLMACNLATARGKPAILRVGGGSFFDHAYRAVSVTWNNNEDNANKYHLVGGGAGTVSAAGGWMASGGLSGTTGMRLFGIGIDQVLHLEMVLPSATHVRFGPSEWETVPDRMAPQTTVVTGYCNYQWELPEEQWEWTECTGDDANIDFNELWFAVRGGGGGTWGIVTSLYYQLHDYPGVLYYTTSDPAIFSGYEEFLFANTPAAYVLTLLYVQFNLRFLYQPATLNVTDLESNGCNSAKSFSLSPFQGGTYFCYGDSAPKLLEKWTEYITSAEAVAAMAEVGVPANLTAALPNLFLPLTEENVAPSYAEASIFLANLDPGWEFSGRVPDEPRAGTVPVIDNFPNYADSTNTHFPLDILETKWDELTALIAEDTLTTPAGQTIYAKGGVIPFVDDGLNALSPTRRSSAFQKAVRNETTRSRYYELFYGDADMTGPFPGQACHNHAHVYEMGPVKSDWTQACPLLLPQAEREELCIAQGENFWGTENLARLEAFKQTLDPDGIFICAAGIGYSNPTDIVNGDSDVAPTSAPIPDTTDSPTEDPEEPKADESATMSLVVWPASAVLFLFGLLEYFFE